jgi:hypothetical protein
LMLDLVDAIPAHVRKQRTVALALASHAWTRDITSPLTIPILVQYLHLRQQLDDVALDHEVDDRIIQKWSSTGQYSTSSAYQLMFLNQSALLGAKETWKVRASNGYTFFFWLAIQDRCWTSESLSHHGFWNNGLCALCRQCDESINHLVLGCVHTGKSSSIPYGVAAGTCKCH